MASGASWRAQYDRMKRWHSRIQAATAVDDLYVDSVYAFFIFCYHLKDWLQADPAVPEKVGQAAEQMISGAFHMSLCADLANGLKHVSVTRRPRLSGPVSFSTQAPAPEFSQDPNDYLGVLPTIHGADGEFIAPAPEIVDLCVNAWETFLRQHRLLV
jgi:hypothetical protein